MMYLTTFIITFSIFLCVSTSDYWSDRALFLNNEKSMSIGNKLQLKTNEQIVNKLLMGLKTKEVDNGFIHPEEFPPARHFFEAYDDIEKSEVFKFIRKMPKGGALHIHDFALLSADTIIQNITYRDSLYFCSNGETTQLIFSEKQKTGCELVRDLRQQNTNYDILLKRNLTLITNNPYKLYPDINTVWNKFTNIFRFITPMLTYRPVFEDYFYNVLQEFYDDNVYYLEIRGTLPELYELNGTQYNKTQTLGLLKNVCDGFSATHSDFIGVKFIYAPSRFVNNQTLVNFIDTYKQLKEVYPDFVVGFDLVGQEDLGQPLSNFIPQLLNISNDTKFYFHAGETNWNGLSTDINIIDAILLNTTRIGHGYALVKHPIALKLVKKRQIAIEINPISNQVLNLVKDVRNHPGNFLIANNYPVVISSDDPSMWGASGLSYDFYEAFMGMANINTDLKLLKQLAMNSIIFSSLTKNDKKLAMKKFLTQWDNFIDDYTIENVESVKNNQHSVVKLDK